MMSDTTAQEAMIPYPNEVGLMNRYMDMVKSTVGKLGGKFREIQGTIKRIKYGFNKPDAKSIAAMVSYGHRAILGFNMTKLVKMLAAE